jgi:Cof subfamily protein (haloacid dehalogenase superfamily)
MVYFNGAEIVEVPSGQVLNATLLDVEAAAYCADMARREGLYYQVYFPQTPQGSGRILQAERWTQEAEMYYRHTGIRPVIGDLREPLRDPGLKGCIKSMFICDPVLHDSIRAELYERFSGRLYVVRSSPEFLEVLHPEVSKGRGLCYVMDYLNLRKDQVIAFGDEENDLPLFRAAGFAAAPENAKEQVRRLADMTIGSNKDDGVSGFLEELFHF